MARRVHLHHQVNRELNAMEKLSNAPALASARARKIIDALIQGTSFPSAGRLSPRTDRRLKNSLKFDLGSGFRLICTREKDAIHVMFLGDHDSCDTWLTRHGRKNPHHGKANKSVARKHAPAPLSQVLSGGNALFEEETDLPEISQKDLRLVFKGLVNWFSAL